VCKNNTAVISWIPGGSSELQQWRTENCDAENRSDTDWFYWDALPSY